MAYCGFRCILKGKQDLFAPPTLSHYLLSPIHQEMQKRYRAQAGRTRRDMLSELCAILSVVVKEAYASKPIPISIYTGLFFKYHVSLLT